MDVFYLMVGSALVSSLITLGVIGLAVKFWLGPKLERHIDDRFEAGADRLTERFVAVLTGKSREMIRERARDLARFMGGRRPPRDDEDGPDL